MKNPRLFFISLHSATPLGERQHYQSFGPQYQTRHEVSYKGYERKSVVEIDGSWKTTDGMPISNLDFGEMSAGIGEYIRYFGVGLDKEGEGRLLCEGNIYPVVYVDKGVTFRLDLSRGGQDLLSMLAEALTPEPTLSIELVTESGALCDGLTKEQCLIRWQDNRDAVEKGLTIPNRLTTKQIALAKNNLKNSG